jgi:hypothetical protein
VAFEKELLNGHTTKTSQRHLLCRVAFEKEFLNGHTTKTSQRHLLCRVAFEKELLNGHTTKTPAEGESTTGCIYHLDLLMMGL